MRFKSDVLALILALAMVFSLAVPAFAAEGSEYAAVTGGVYSENGISKYGNVTLDIYGSELMDAGYEYGDIVTVTVGENSYEMPFCTNYADVDNGSYVLRHNATYDSLEIAINMGDFATTSGLAVKKTAEDGTITWDYDEETVITISMSEKAGYLNEYLIRQLKRTNDRADYSSDAVFANFRNVAMGGLGVNALYRSSNPANNELGRAAYADDLTEAAGIQTVMNLADSDEAIKDYMAAEGFDSPYYASLFESGKVKALNLGVDFSAPDFQAGLAEGLRFFAENKGPYLVHCTEGKDRAGFVIALLEALMGAAYEEIVADYMVTYINYYHVVDGSEQYTAIANSNIVKTLATIASVSVDTLAETDLAVAAAAYIEAIGLSAEEVAQLKANLAADYTAESEEPEEPAEAEIAKIVAEDGTEYCRLRDLAYAAIGTENAFDVDWTAETGVTITIGGVYDAEALPAPVDGVVSAATITITVDGEAVEVAVLLQNEHYYISAEGLAALFGIKVSAAA